MSTNTIGNIVKTARERKGLDLALCSNYLKIQIKYLKAIEEDDYRIFENSFQAQGFFSNYAEFLELNTTSLIPRWKKDVSDFFPNENFNVKRFYKPKRRLNFKIVLTLEKILYSVGTVIVTAFLIYVYTTYQSTMYNPTLEISEPENNSIVETDIVDIFGKTDADAILSLNNEKLTIQTDGNFSTSIKLSEGINNFKFSSVNPYGKESVNVLTIIYRPRRMEIYNPPVETPEAKTENNISETNPSPVTN